MLRILLLAAIVAMPVAQACSGSQQIDDPRGDTNPPGLPGFVDLLAINVTTSPGFLNWSWDLASFELAQSVRYWGQFDLGTEPRDDSTLKFHPDCELVTLSPTSGIQCYLKKTDGPVAGAVTFRTLGPLESQIEGSRLTVTIPFDMLGIDVTNVTDIGSAGALTQIMLGIQDDQNQPTYVSPTVQDSIDPLFTMHLCTLEPPPDSEPAETETSRQAPAMPFVAILAGLLIAAFKRR